MPRAKRPLQEVDANVARPAPKAAKGAKGKRRIDPTADSGEDDLWPPGRPEFPMNTILRRDDIIEWQNKYKAWKDEHGIDRTSVDGEPDEEGEEQDEEPVASSSKDAIAETRTNPALIMEEAYQYYTMRRPWFDYKAEIGYLPKRVKFKTKTMKKRYVSEQKAFKHQLVSDNPEHRWVILGRAWVAVHDMLRDTRRRCPDALEMYVYNDFFGYGQLEMLENAVASYQREYAKKSRDVKKMWIAMSALAHYMKLEELGPFMMIDDGERNSMMIALIGSAFLSMLHTLDQAGQLKAGSDYKDLGLVMGLFATIGNELCESRGEDQWHERILEYAQDRQIDISVVFEAKKMMDEYDFDVREKWPRGKKDPWQFAKKFKEYKDEYGLAANILAGARKSIGGDSYDITLMEPSERAEAAFDKKDPLAGIPRETLDKSKLMF